MEENNKQKSKTDEIEPVADKVRKVQAPEVTPTSARRAKWRWAKEEGRRSLKEEVAVVVAVVVVVVVVVVGSRSRSSSRRIR